jgi:hypothetical protein
VCNGCERRGTLVVTCTVTPAANAQRGRSESSEPVDVREVRAFTEQLKTRSSAGALPAPRADIDG